VIRALKVDKGFTEAFAWEFASCDGLLLDSPCAGHGGSGQTFEWAAMQWESLRRAAPASKLYLAGGLHAGNVAEAMAVVHPDVVDVCSGVESAKGIKSVSQMREFVAAVRAAERQER
jgi:phosphoribosylanthranilate isomerase